MPLERAVDSGHSKYFQWALQWMLNVNSFGIVAETRLSFWVSPCWYVGVFWAADPLADFRAMAINCLIYTCTNMSAIDFWPGFQFFLLSVLTAVEYLKYLMMRTIAVNGGLFDWIGPLK